MSAGYTVPLIVTGMQDMQQAGNLALQIGRNANTAASQVETANKKVQKSVEKTTEDLEKQRLAIVKIQDTAAKDVKGKKNKREARAGAISAQDKAFLNLLEKTKALLKDVDGFVFSKLEKEFQQLSLSESRWNEKVAQSVSAMRLAEHAKMADSKATEKQQMAYNESAAAMRKYNAEIYSATAANQSNLRLSKYAIDSVLQHNEALVKLRQEKKLAQTQAGQEAANLRLEIKGINDAYTAEERRRQGLAKLRQELKAVQDSGGEEARLKYRIQMANEDALASDKRARATQNLASELLHLHKSEGTDAKLEQSIKQQTELYLLEGKRAHALTMLGKEMAYYSDGEGKAFLVDQKRLQGMKQVATVRQDALNQIALLEARQTALTIEEQKEEAVLRQIASLTAKKNDQLAKSDIRVKTLASEVSALTASETKVAQSTKTLTTHFNLANQGAAALRSTIYGLGASFGVFTSSTLLVASGFYAISSAMRAGVSEALSYEKALAALGARASTQAAGSSGYARDLAKLNKGALEASNSMIFTTVQTTEAMTQLALAGLNVDESIAATIPTMRLAAVGQLDFAQAADISTNVMMGFGMEVEQLPRIIDVLSKAATESNTDVTQLGNAMSYAAPISNAFGISLEYTAAAMEVLANAGIKSSRAGTGMRRVLVSLFTPTEKISEAMGAFGISLGQVDESMQGLESLEQGAGNLMGGLTSGAAEAQRMLEEFYIATAGGTKNLQLLRQAVGVYALPAMTQLVKSVGMGTKSVQDFAKGLEDAAGNSEQQMLKMMDSISAVWDQMKASSGVLATKMFDEEKTGIREFLDSLKDVVRALAASDNMAKPIIDAVTAIGTAVLKTIAILVAYKTVVLAVGIATLAFQKTLIVTTAMFGLLSKLPALFAAIRAAAAGAAIALASFKLAGTFVGLLGVGLGKFIISIAPALAAMAALAYAAYQVYKHWSGIPEAIDAVNSAQERGVVEITEYTSKLKESYDIHLKEGKLIEMKKESRDLQIQIANNTDKSVESTQRLKKQYEELNVEIAKASGQVKAFAKEQAELVVADLRTEARNLRKTPESVTDSWKKYREAVKSGNDSEIKASDEIYQKQLLIGKATLASADAKEAEARAYSAMRDAQLTDSDEAKAVKFKAAQDAIAYGIAEQTKLIDELNKSRYKGSAEWANAMRIALAALDALKDREKEIANARRISTEAEVDGVMTLARLNAQKAKTDKEHLASMKLIAGSAEERAAAELAAANTLATKQAEVVRQLEYSYVAATLLAEQYAELGNSKAAEVMVQGAGSIYADLLAAQALLNAAAKERIDLSEASSKATDKEAKAMTGLIKTAAELHKAKLDLIKDQQDFQRAFSDTNEQVLSRGVELFQELTTASREYGKTLKEVTIYGAQLPGAVGGSGGDVGGRYSELFNKYGAKNRVPPALLKAVAWAESSFNPAAESGAGAVGLMQFTGPTAKDYGLKNRRDPEQSVDAGSRYLRNLLDRFGSVELALAGYNAGPNGSALKAGRIPNNPETQAYVPKVMKKFAEYSAQTTPVAGAPTEASTVEQNLALVDQSKTVVQLTSDFDDLTEAQKRNALATQEKFQFDKHMLGLKAKEEQSWKAAIAAYQQADQWNMKLAADGELSISQMEAAKLAQEQYSAAIQANTGYRKARLEQEERAIRNGQINTVIVKRESGELDDLREKYVEGAAALKDYNYHMAMLRNLRDEGRMTPEEFARGVDAATKAMQSAQGPIQAFFASITYGAKEFETIWAGVMSEATNSLADFIATGKMDFEGFLTFLRDAAAKMAAENIMASLFAPSDTKTGSTGGLLSGIVKVASSAIGSLFGGGVTANALGNVVTSTLPHGVYTAPTLFPMATPGRHAFANGIGLLGEAGAEGVLPLDRINGKLGVNASGVAPAVNVVVNTRPGETAKVSQDGNTLTIDIIEDMLSARIARGATSLPRSIESSYAGVRRGGR